MAPAALLSGRITTTASSIRPTASASNVTSSSSQQAASNHTHRERNFSSRCVSNVAACYLHLSPLTLASSHRRSASLNDVKPTSDDERMSSSPSRAFRAIEQPQPAAIIKIEDRNEPRGAHAVSLSAEAKPFGFPSSVTPSISQSVASLSLSIPRDHNSVSIKSNTSVKDAAGAIFKVLERIPSALITALRLEPGCESVNRAVKSIAVARKYLQDHQPLASEPRYELSFLPVHRSNSYGIVDPNLFAFLAFKIKLSPSLQALLSENSNDPQQDSLDDISVGRKSDVHSTANAIIRAVAAKGRAVMKAGGSDAVFVAMSALTSARQELKTRASDLMAVASWRTQDTCGFLGRETKYLHFAIVPCAPNGPLFDAV